MALDLKTFRAEYPEFHKAPDVVVVRVLAHAARRTPANIWGDLEDEGHGLLTAHLLAMRPEGKEMRLEGRDRKDSIYGIERQHLNRIVASGFRVTGQDT